MTKSSIFFSIAISIIGLILLFSIFSCDSDEEYNRGYSAGNRAGYNKGFEEGKKEGHRIGHNEGNESGKRTGYNNGYNVAKNEYQKQINDLQNRITAMENNHKTQLTESHNRGFLAGQDFMENLYNELLDKDFNEKMKRGKRNSVLDRIR